MRTSRPAGKLGALGLPGDKGRIAGLVLRHTTTLGVRMNEVGRLMLAREVRTIETRFGNVRVKRGTLGGEVIKEMPEYDDVRRIARETGLSMSAVRAAVAEDAEIQTL